jgi:hypothetical protein
LSSSFLSSNTKVKINVNILLLVVLYGCETWSLILKEERRLKGFDRRVLKKIYRSKWDEVVNGWKILHNEELYGLYSSPNIIRAIKSRRMRRVGHVGRMGDRTCA